MHCPFCRVPPDKYLAENEHFFVIRDIRPVTPGHCLIVAKRHVPDFFALESGEMASLHDLALRLKAILEQELQPEAYNLGMNCGAAAGQSVFHFHLHFIPRSRGDRRSLRDLREFIFRPRNP
ncbi:MAG TPA: HIT family protein [Candidatus Syntrophosphaera sp.]|nr:HIT family protein [Candidatus Syntrophosphaera sp.]